MSDGGTWQAPQPEGSAGSTPPPPPPPSGGFGAPPPPGAPAPDVLPAGPPATATASSDQPGGRKPGRIIALVAGAALLLAAGGFAISRLGGGDDSSAGGAATAEEAGLALMTALENEDVLGMVDVLLPGERETMREPLTELVAELSRLEVLDDGTSLSSPGGFDLVMEGEAVTAVATNVDDIVNLELSGTVQATVDGEALPIGDFVRDLLPDDAEMSELDTETPAQEFDDLPLTAVEHDGRWYVSAFYTAAEQARIAAESWNGEPLEIPVEGIAPSGGDSPEDAFDAMLDSVSRLDLSGIVAALNPNEFAALQRYAPLFIGDGQTEIDAAGVTMRLDEAQYDTSVDGDTATIAITYLAGAITAEGETATFSYEDGCLIGEVPGEDLFNTCDIVDENRADGMSPEIQDAAEQFNDLLADYVNPGVLMKRVDGTWYLSPVATGAEQVLAVLRALDRAEIDSAIDAVTGAIDSAVEETDFIVDELDNDADVDVATTEEASVEQDPTFDCYEMTSGGAASECFLDLVAAGEIEPAEVPLYLRAPECGLADAYWGGDLTSMGDAEFVAAIEKAAPCFQALVEAGEIDEFDLPPEIAKPECLEGRNWYAVDDDAYSDRFFDCVYS